MGLLLKNGSILEKSDSDTLRRADILVEKGAIIAIESAIVGDSHEVIDVTGKVILPGFIDMHVHLRQPGFEKKETIETGTMSAARGGFTTIACMPNTKPVLDTPEMIEWVNRVARTEGAIRVLPIGAITIRELGETLTDMQGMKEAGVVAFSDDGVGVQSSQMMKDAMIRAKELGMPIVAHCEDNSLAHGGVVHDGDYAKRHGLKGIPNEAEAIHVGRDSLLAEVTGAHYHVCHISAKESVRYVREAKARGVKVTAEVTPHHLLLTDEDIPGENPLYKMNPPLRSREDLQALIEGLQDGTIDIIATDHAPHTMEEKERGMKLAPFGIVGLETAFPLLYTHLVKKGILTLGQLVDKMTRKPAELFNLPYGRIEVGVPADITVVDLEMSRKIDPEEFLSKGKNTPFSGWECQGWSELTMVEGKIVWSTGGTHS